MSSAEVRAHSAVHVLKGAVMRVLGARMTTSVHESDGRATLTVQFERKPSQEEEKRIEDEANKKIREDSEVLQFEMDREEAEAHFGKGIYDAFPIPETITRLKLVRIPEWEINTCASPHVESTAEIGGLKVDKIRFREAKKLLEIEFHLQS